MSRCTSFGPLHPSRLSAISLASHRSMPFYLHPSKTAKRSSRIFLALHRTPCHTPCHTPPIDRSSFNDRLSPKLSSRSPPVIHCSPKLSSRSPPVSSKRRSRHSLVDLPSDSFDGFDFTISTTPLLPPAPPPSPSSTNQRSVDSPSTERGLADELLFPFDPSEEDSSPPINHLIALGISPNPAFDSSDSSTIGEEAYRGQCIICHKSFGLRFLNEEEMCASCTKKIFPDKACST
jgi:hypothetical protein